MMRDDRANCCVEGQEQNQTIYITWGGLEQGWQNPGFIFKRTQLTWVF